MTRTTTAISIFFFWVLMVPVPARAATWAPLGGEQFRHQLVRSVAVYNQQVAIVADGTLYRSYDQGVTWTEDPTVRSPKDVLFDPGVPGRLVVTSEVDCLYVDQPGLGWQHVVQADALCRSGQLTATADAVYELDSAGGGSSVKRLSRDNRLTSTNYALTGTRERAFVIAGATSSPDLYVAGSQDIYRSSDAGGTWQPLARPLPYVCCIGSVVVADDGLMVAYGDRIYKSADYGTNWSSVGEPALEHQLGTIALIGNQPYFGLANQAGTEADVAISTTLPAHGLGLGLMPIRLAVLNHRLVAATAQGLWMDQDRLASWAAIKRPVIVIPGIMGSWPKQFGLFGELVLDPLTHAYDPLVDGLHAAGFREDRGTLRTFPYAWRQPNDVSALQLAQVIKETKAQCRCPKVDLVTHSMGGLVARAYIEGDGYQGDVARLVQIATPNAGSVKAYFLQENGEFYNDSPLLSGSRLSDAILRTIFQLEAGAHGYANFGAYVRERVPSVGELLPVTDYLIGRSYPTGYPPNPFLERLNSHPLLERLSGRVGLYLLGSRSLRTLSSLVLAPPAGGIAWPDGKPRVMSEAEGDGTVPLDSLEALRTADVLREADHTGLVAATTNDVVTYLLGDEADAAYLQHQADGGSAPPAPVPSMAARNQAVVIMVPVALKLGITDRAGSVSKPSSQTMSNVYRFVADGQDTILIRDPTSAQDALRLTAERSDPITITLIELDDQGRRRDVPVTLGRSSSANLVAATVHVGRLGSGPSAASSRSDRHDGRVLGAVTGLLGAPRISPPPTNERFDGPRASKPPVHASERRRQLVVVAGIGLVIVNAGLVAWVRR